VFSELGLSPDLLIGTGATPDQEFQVSQPVNSEGGALTGFEINIQQSLDFLPGPLSHLGILANYTHVNSDIEYLTSPVPGDPTVRATLVGLSKHAANGTLYYEDGRFSIRGSVAYRSGYLTQVPGSDGNEVHGTNGTINVDMQMSYNITDRLRFSIEALNLTDQYNDLYVGFSNRLNVYTHTGRQFLVGLRYSM
jgi:TonB-dependent receptor